MYFHYAQNLKVKNVQVRWEKPESPHWQSAMYFQDIKGLRLEGFSGGPAKPDFGDPAVVLDQVQGASIFDSTTPAGTKLFLQVKGDKSREICLHSNELHAASTPYRTDSDVQEGSVKETDSY
jgi:hypothetical protein